MELRLTGSVTPASQPAKCHAHRQPQTNQVSNKFGETVASVPQHGCGASGTAQHRNHPGRKQYPQEKGAAETPNESRTRVGCSPRKEQTECQSEQRAKRGSMHGRTG